VAIDAGYINNDYIKFKIKQNTQIGIGMIGLSVALCIMAKRYVLQEKTSEQVNRKCHARNSHKWQIHFIIINNNSRTNSLVLLKIN